ncbi:MAG: hypothetical protein D6756_10050 [Cyanobacteria bacterium J083]|nr:MAG: hypothetical protein D6756_10050 [Cyanobacteria bacterium J083]
MFLRATIFSCFVSLLGLYLGAEAYYKHQSSVTENPPAIGNSEVSSVEQSASEQNSTKRILPPLVKK